MDRSTSIDLILFLVSKGKLIMPILTICGRFQHPGKAREGLFSHNGKKIFVALERLSKIQMLGAMLNTGGIYLPHSSLFISSSTPQTETKTCISFSFSPQNHIGLINCCR